jgi:hypothetical protein
MKSEIQKINTGFAIYKTDNKVVKVNVRLEEETVWLTQANPADLFQTSRSDVTMHIKNILGEGEFQEISVCKDFLHAAEGNGKLEKTAKVTAINGSPRKKKKQNNFTLELNRILSYLPFVLQRVGFVFRKHNFLPKKYKFLSPKY